MAAEPTRDADCVVCGEPFNDAAEVERHTTLWHRQGADYVLLSPRQRWGTCCLLDPECEHSFLDDAELARWMDTPICDGEAEEYER